MDTLKRDGWTIRPKEPVEKPDEVNRPSHYTRWKIEPIEFLMKNNVAGWLFNVVKYAMRAGHKVPQGMTKVEAEVQDLKKAARYIEMRINQLLGKDQL